MKLILTQSRLYLGISLLIGMNHAKPYDMQQTSHDPTVNHGL
jgi:hypothetical protein